ncbi:MAG: hypothetical protein ACRCXZ_08020 [Patescibacteria group bacterium]
MLRNENFKEYFNSLAIGLGFGLVFSLTFPLVLKSFLDSHQVPEFYFNTLGRNIITNRNPLKVDLIGTFDVWTVDAIILLLAITIALFNLLITFIILKTTSKNDTIDYTPKHS